ncbi:MAG: hypothetical protein V4437_00915 [Patescibacteria group bacterium]
MEKPDSNVVVIKEWKKNRTRSEKLEKKREFGPSTYAGEAALAAARIRRIRADASRKRWEKILAEGGARFNFLAKSPGLFLYTLFRVVRGKETMIYGPADAIGESLYMQGTAVAGLTAGAVQYGHAMIALPLIAYGIYSGLTSDVKRERFSKES